MTKKLMSKHDESIWTKFVDKGRRRTDHPLVVGMIVICLGVTALTQIGTFIAAVRIGSFLFEADERHLKKEKESNDVRARILKAFEDQRYALLRVCVNGAKTEKDLNDCRLPSTTGLPRSDKK